MTTRETFMIKAARPTLQELDRILLYPLLFMMQPALFWIHLDLPMRNLPVKLWLDTNFQYFLSQRFLLQVRLVDKKEHILCTNWFLSLWWNWIWQIKYLKRKRDWSHFFSSSSKSCLFFYNWSCSINGSFNRGFMICWGSISRGVNTGDSLKLSDSYWFFNCN